MCKEGGSECVSEAAMGQYRTWCLHSLPPALGVRKMKAWYRKVPLGLDAVSHVKMQFCFPCLIARVVDGHFVSCLGVIALSGPCSSESEEPVCWLEASVLYWISLYF